MDKSQEPNIVCFGVLYDVFPTHKEIGGAAERSVLLLLDFR
jgi:hypothetical protein